MPSDCEIICEEDAIPMEDELPEVDVQIPITEENNQSKHKKRKQEDELEKLIESLL